VRYATNGQPRSLFASSDVDTVRHLYPENERLKKLSHGDRVIVSEPFSDLPGAWQEIPPATAVTLRRGEGPETRPFQPASVSPAVAAPERLPVLDA
jgi:glutamine amidotransferase